MRWIVPVCAVALLVSACSSSESAPNSGDPATAGADLTTKKSTVRIPLVAENEKTERRSLMSSFNAKLAAAGVAPLPDFVEVDGRKAAQTHSDLASKFDEAANKLKLGVVALTAAAPSDYQRTSKTVPAICYTGDAHKVPELLLAATDTVFTEQLGVHAWKFKHEIHAGEVDPASEDFQSLDIPDIWSEWRGEGEAVLVLTHMGDDGTDVEAAVIGKCKK